MITLKDSSEIDMWDVLRRSPEAELPGAEEALRECMGRSVKVRCGLYYGRVACMWGLIPPCLLSDRAYMWLLTTNIVDEHKFLFIRYSQRYVEDMLKVYRELYGFVVVGNDKALRWLKWLGAEFSPPVKGRIDFVIRRK